MFVPSMLIIMILSGLVTTSLGLVFGLTAIGHIASFYIAASISLLIFMKLLVHRSTNFRKGGNGTELNIRTANTDP